MHRQVWKGVEIDDESFVLTDQDNWSRGGDNGSTEEEEEGGSFEEFREFNGNRARCVAGGRHRGESRTEGGEEEGRRTRKKNLRFVTNK